MGTEFEVEVKKIKKITARIKVEVPEGRGEFEEDIFALMEEKASAGETVLSDELCAEIEPGMRIVSRFAGWVVNGTCEVIIVYEGLVE